MFAHAQHKHNRLFKNIWAWKGPQRARLLLWKIANDALLTIFQRKHRHLSVKDQCQICMNGSESMLHVMCDYDFAARIWRKLIIPSASVWPCFFTQTQRFCYATCLAFRLLGGCPLLKIGSN